MTLGTQSWRLFFCYTHRRAVAGQHSLGQPNRLPSRACENSVSAVDTHTHTRSVDNRSRRPWVASYRQWMKPVLKPAMSERVCGWCHAADRNRCARSSSGAWRGSACCGARQQRVKVSEKFLPRSIYIRVAHWPSGTSLADALQSRGGGGDPPPTRRDPTAARQSSSSCRRAQSSPGTTTCRPREKVARMSSPNTWEVGTGSQISSLVQFYRIERLPSAGAESSQSSPWPSPPSEAPDPDRRQLHGLFSQYGTPESTARRAVVSNGSSASSSALRQLGTFCDVTTRRHHGEKLTPESGGGLNSRLGDPAAAPTTDDASVPHGHFGRR